MDNMQLWLSSSTDSINLNDSAEGFYLNPDLEGLTGLPEIRSVNGLNAGYDGGWTATQLWAARLITIRGVIAINDKAAVEDKRKALAKILSQGKNEDLELKFVSEAGNTYTTTVRTSYCTMALQRVFWRQEYQIQLRANDPLIYDDGGSELVAILRVMAGEGGFEIPFDIPFDIGGSITPTSVDVGDEATYPLIRLKGDLHNPTIINMTTNQRMQVLADIITTVEWHDYTTTYTTDGFTQIGDGLDGAPLSLTHLYGNATQETLSGKNLFNLISQTGTSGGLTNTWTNNTCSTTGSTPAGSGQTASTIAQLANISLSAGTYTMSVQQAVQQKFIIQLHNADTNTWNWNVASLAIGSTSTTFTINYNADQARLAYSPLEYGTTYNLTTKQLMLEKSATPTAFEPYVGGVPMPNPQFPSPVNTVSSGQLVQVAGKNLLDTSNPGNQTNIGGMTSTWNNGAVDVKGTNTATSFPLSNVIMFPFVLKAGTTITVSTKEASSTGNTVFRCLGTDGVYHESAFFASGTRSGTLTLSYDIKGVQLYKGSVPTNVYREFSISEWQIEIGSTATSYEPYQEQSYEINLGKNLACINTSATKNIGGVDFTIENGVIKVASGTTSSYGNFYFDTFRVLSGESSFWMEISGYTPAPSDNCTYVLQQSSDNGSTWSNAAQMSFASPSTQHPTLDASKLYRIRWYAPPSVSFSNAQIKFMLEYGSTKTEFAPYFTPLELAKIGTYQDYIWNDGGTWYIHKEVGKVVFDGSETGWAKSYGGTPNFFYRYREIADYAGPTNTANLWLSDKMTPANIASNSTVFGGMILGAESVYHDVRIRYGTEMATADWQAYLATNPITIYYASNTPTDEAITDQDLIAQLDHIYSLYGGVNNLWLIPSGGAQGEMVVSYATTEDIDYHEVVIDCQARTVTQDGHNLYPALAEGSEFIRLLPGENKLYLTSEVESDNGTAEVKFKKGNISI